MLLRKYFISFFLFLLVGNLLAQKKYSNSSRDTSVKILADDPIVAALDSLAYMKLFEGGRYSSEFSRQGISGISPDSVPVAEPTVMAERLAKLDAQSPFKLVYNEEVRNYINMYTIRKRAQVARMMGLSELYFPLFEEKLAKHKMPLELKCLAIIESALNPAAKSRAGAQGLWQFMYGTGKLFGLKVTSYTDERCDPLKSTEAACQYMKYLYSIYKDWSLVLAAYNSGPGNVNKAIRRSGGKTDYWELRPFLPKETAGYVPAFIAAVYMMHYTREHNLFPVKPKAIFHEIDTLHINKRVTFSQLSTVLDMSQEDIAFLNPTFLLEVIPETDTYHVLTLPKDKVATFMNNEETIFEYTPKPTTQIKSDTVAKEIVSPIAPAEIKKHTVRSGESISMVARRYGITVNQIKSWNNLRSSKIHRGQSLIVSPPYKAQVQEIVNKDTQNSAENTKVTPKDSREEAVPKTQKTNNSNTKAKDTAKKFSYYKVKRGDTHWKIAVNHGMTLNEFHKLNRFNSKSKLVTGMKVKVKSKK